MIHPSKLACLALVACLGVAVTARTAHAEGSTRESRMAKRFAREGARAFAAGQYNEAISAFRTAFELYPKPELLFNLAQAQRISGDHAAALRSYERYVELEPSGPASDDARTHIAILVSEVKPKAAPTAKQTAEEEEAERVQRARALAAQQEQEGLVLRPASPPPPPPTPVYKKWWLWTTVSVVAAGAVAVGLGVGLTRPHPAEFSPSLPTFGSSGATANGTGSAGMAIRF